MNRLARHALIAELVRELDLAGSWCGRAHVQKTLFAFQALCAPPPELRLVYQLYRHGPYSFQLDADLAEMEVYGALRREERPPYGPRYVLAPGAAALLERYGGSVPQFLPNLRFAAAELGNKTARELEALCTAIYVAGEPGAAADGAARLGRVRALKPHLSENEIRVAQEEHARLRAAVPAALSRG
jgi:hypothetical protein